MRQPIPLPGPEIYNGIEERGLTTDIFTGWHSTDPVFARLISEVKPRFIIEVGTWKGGSAIHMAGLAALTLETEFCVDHFLGGCDHIWRHLSDSQGVQRDTHGWPGVYYQFLYNVKVSGFSNRIVPIPMMTADGAALLRAHDVTAELIYIDADHSYRGCMDDIRSYLPLLASGGIIFGDDYERESVKLAVKDAFELSEPPKPADENGTFWAMRKP